MSVDVIESIRDQLKRLGASGVAGMIDVGPHDTIGVRDLAIGDVLLTASPGGANFYWHGRASDALARLSRLPDGSGTQAIRSEFESNLDSSE